jgi:DNA-binding transcriptional MerR regulator
MADVETPTGYLSIGEVLGLLLEEFPDITISKIRFLESQGLISPERTTSGYRKFYDHDVQLLRVILAEQRENYLPLRVIKDRLDSGEIDPTGEHLRADGDGDVDEGGDTPAASTDVSLEANHNGVADDLDHTPAEVPRAAIRAHPAARAARDMTNADTTPNPSTATRDAAGEPRDAGAVPDGPRPGAQLLPGVLLERAELCTMVGITDAELAELESFGIVSPRPNTTPPLYGDDAIEIARPACEFLRSGVDARHLRAWRTSAEREASLYEQLVTPRYRQRNPEARADALAQLRRLDVLGGALRAALTRQALRHHFEA